MPVQNYPGRVVATCERCVWAKGAIHNSVRYTIRHRFPVAQTQAYEGALKGPVVSRSPTTFAHDTQVPTHCVPRIQQRIPLRGPTVIIRTETSPFCFRSEPKNHFSLLSTRSYVGRDGYIPFSEPTSQVAKINRPPASNQHDRSSSEEFAHPSFGGSLCSPPFLRKVSRRSTLL